MDELLVPKHFVKMFAKKNLILYIIS